MTAADKNRRDPVEQLAEKFLCDVRSGKAVTIEQYQQRFPKHAAAIEALFPTLLMMEDLKPTTRQRRDSADTLLERDIKTLGDFRIVRRIGYGGMGIVYEARQESLNRTVAVKVFAPTLLTSARLIRRFQREAKAAGALHHSNIVPVLGVGEQWGIHFYIMQLIDGKNLGQVIDGDGAWLRAESAFRLRRNWQLIGEIGRQIASALSYAHGRNVLHRDIKPANLLLARDGTAWIADFGLAKLTTDDDGATRTGQAIGTLRYMAPEQLEGHFDERSDVYSLGLTLYELLTWRQAFDESNHRQLVRQKAVELPPRPRSIDPTIPRDLETIILKATAREPADRYATAEELRDDLDRFQADRPITARRVSWAERIIRWSRRNRALATACAGMIGLTIFTLGLSLWGYARLQQALSGETSQRRRATATAALATGALDSVFDRFGIEPISAVGRVAEPLLSSEAASLLEDLLHYYEQLAGQDANNPDLILKTAQAQATIGNIRERLGQYAAGITAYEAALESYGRLPKDTDRQITVARLNNQIGQVLRFQTNDGTGRARHRLAMEVLLPGADADPQQITSVATRRSPNGHHDTGVQFEVARTCYLLGASIRPGMGPHSMPPEGALTGHDIADVLAFPLDDSDSVRWLDAAIELLEDLLAHKPTPAAYRQLLARCLRERVHDNLAKRSGADDALEARSLEILSTLVDENPASADYQFDLVETLAEFSVFGGSLDDRARDRAGGRLDHALELGEALIARRPDVASYALVVAHAHFKMAVVCQLDSRQLRGPARITRLTSAMDHFSTAIDHHSDLLARFPDATGFAVWQAYFRGRLAGVYLDDHRPLAAQESVVRAIESLENLSQLSDHPIIDRMTDWAYGILDRTFKATATPRHLLPSSWESTTVQ